VRLVVSTRSIPWWLRDQCFTGQPLRCVCGVLSRDRANVLSLSRRVPSSDNMVVRHIDGKHALHGAGETNMATSCCTLRLQATTRELRGTDTGERFECALQRFRVMGGHEACAE
jgi:hypothetical protein